MVYDSFRTQSSGFIETIIRALPRVGKAVSGMLLWRRRECETVELLWAFACSFYYKWAHTHLITQELCPWECHPLQMGPCAQKRHTQERI